jgi:predicted secreted protein
MVGAAGSSQVANVTTGGLIFNAATNALSITGNVTGGNVLAITIANAASFTGGLVSVTGSVITGGGVVSRVVSIADATSVTINADTTDLATQTNTQVTGTLTINAPTGTLANGQKFTFRLQSSNVQTFSWNVVFSGSTDLSLPTTSSGSSKYDYMGFIYNSTAIKWQLLAKNFGF